jgi:hypothetical protein
MTPGEAREILDNVAADDPLTALREFPDLLDPYRLSACALAEPAAALAYAHDLLTPEQRIACDEAVRERGLLRYVPDRLAAERRRLIAMARGEEP